MKTINGEYDFDLKTIVYIFAEIGQEPKCISFKTYLNEKELHEGKLLILAHPETPIYFREG